MLKGKKFDAFTLNDREGTEWVGSYQVPGTCYDVVLKLRECKQQGSVFEVTKEGKTEEL